MNDRQLLELAAKAEGRSPPYDKHGVFSAWVGDMENGHWWNPLDDDGDALRLLMTLDMSVNCNRDELTVIVQTWRPKPIKAVRPKLFKAVRNNVKDADVRRCIVEVAAMIGKEMR